VRFGDISKALNEKTSLLWGLKLIRAAKDKEKTETE
jgi:hypothetical protein